MKKALSALAAVLALGAPALAAVDTPACGPAGAHGSAGGYPTFCSIPRTPTDIRGASAFKATVVETRLAGRDLLRRTAPETFGLPLGEAAAFSQSGRAQATPPPEAGASAGMDTAAFAAEARRKATPPPKSHR